MNNISRRDFLKLAGLSAMALACGGCSSISEAVQNMGYEDLKDIKKLRQIIGADDSMRTIMWNSGAAQDANLIVRGRNGETILPAASRSFYDEYIQSVTVTGLEPGQDYKYRIICGSEATSWHPLKSMNKDRTKFLVFPDSQSSDSYDGWKELFQDACKRNSDADFFVNMGDLVDNGASSWQWDCWFDSVKGVIEDKPIVPLMGNHELYDLDWNESMPDMFLQLFDVPENGSARFSKYYFSYDVGNIHFVVLNTMWWELDAYYPGIRGEQVRWLREDLAASDKRWTVVMMHRDVLCYNISWAPRDEGFEDIGTTFMPIFDEYGVDLVLTAHLHTYRNRGHIYNFHESVEGPLYILTGVAGNIRYNGMWVQHSLDKVVAPQPETDNYLTVEADRNNLAVTSFFPDGSVMDRAEINK